MSSVAELEAQLSEARTRERQLHLTLDALPVLVSFVDAEERYGFANRAYENWFGIPREQLVGKKVREVIGEAAYKVLGPFVKRGLAGERFGFEQRGVPYRLGGKRDIRVSFVPRQADDGSVEGYVALLEDVTEQHRAQDILQKQSEFEQQLIGIVSHDLRNPVTAITIGAGMLLRQPDLEERFRKSLLRILSSAERATRMIRDLLDFTQARLAGGLPVKRSAIDLHQVTHQVVEETLIAHPDRVIQLQQSGDGRGAWDGDRLAQVISNLVSNALNYGAPAEPIVVRTRGDSTSVVLEVHNQGPPIPAELLPRLFQPMQRGDAPATVTARNVGLGLYIVSRIVEAHGGTVQVVSSAEAGTTFTVRLPKQP